MNRLVRSEAHNWRSASVSARRSAFARSTFAGDTAWSITTLATGVSPYLPSNAIDVRAALINASAWLPLPS